MKKDIHPAYRKVIFKDINTDFSILVGSTIKTSDMATWTDGKEYPIYKAEISSSSHPFYTGNQKIMDTEGRVERFMKRFGGKTGAINK
jgi:large subunit ribosomal protein L31